MFTAFNERFNRLLKRLSGLNGTVTKAGYV